MWRNFRLVVTLRFELGCGIKTSNCRDSGFNRHTALEESFNVFWIASALFMRVFHRCVRLVSPRNDSFFHVFHGFFILPVFFFLRFIEDFVQFVDVCFAAWSRNSLKILPVLIIVLLKRSENEIYVGWVVKARSATTMLNKIYCYINTVLFM